MVRSIDTIQIHRPSDPRQTADRERRIQRPTAGASGLAGAALLLIGVFFLTTRPTADSPPSKASTETEATVAAPASANTPTEPGPPEIDRGQSVEEAIILDRPLASSKAQDGSTGSTAPSEPEPIAAPQPDSFTTRILNGSGRTGAATKVEGQLTKLGFHITTVGTAVNAYEQSVIYYSAGHELQAKALQSAFGHADATIEQSQIASPADVLLVIGASAPSLDR